MAGIPDDTKVVHLNVPGTHDTSTWDYSNETQAALEKYTGPLYPADVFRCQQDSILQSLNDGVRLFDMRYSYNPGNDTIGFYHASALLAPTTTIHDVFFGFYNWLLAHPTEALFISLKYESGPRRVNDAVLQEKLYGALFDGPAARFWVGAENQLGTLGQVRGKITLLQRFDWDRLPATSSGTGRSLDKRMGIHLSPSVWTDSGADIKIVYNNASEPQGVAFIEDFYEPPSQALPGGAGLAQPEAGIRAKFDAVAAHLKDAHETVENKDQLYITFASGEVNVDGVTPKIMAMGNGTTLGVNQRLLAVLHSTQRNVPNGKARLGMIMLDFYKNVPELVQTIIDMNLFGGQH